MEKLQLTLLFKIIGLGSASGLLFQEDTILSIGDNSSFLYEYQINSQKLERYPLAENPQENIVKKQKHDFEAITQYQDTVYIFGSGSKKNRNKMIQFDTKTKKIISTNDLSDLYATLCSFGKINDKDFNLEGVIYNGETWFLFNRGNGKTNKNIVFSVEGKDLATNFKVIANEYKLPKIKGIRCCFTDAVLVEDKIYFLATAENTESTYNDGEILGSLIGCIDVKSMKIDFTKIITDIHKFEGIALYKKSKEEIEFLLCEDNDTEALVSNIFKLKIDF